MSVRQFVVCMVVSGLPRAFGVWAVFSGLFQLGSAAVRWRRSGDRWGMLSSGARSALAGALLSSDAMGAVYFFIAGSWWSADGFRRKGARPS
ncbi:hypothetical protein C7405_101374 [Paraburkholderia caballeronis]|uniref:hypothetical protein n=1 Tax=Paraburkholderia caballeronis TaxID=416943 RepID=UPI0010657777|nr:hypothetical protein [Paraburkholderia caballeronis]TDV39257.1 hypothetical protein C7405_101374 [Paraburkholderia caballeronis]